MQFLRRLSANARRPVAIALLFVTAIIQIAAKIPAHGELRYDFSIYYLSALALREHRNPYAQNYGGLEGIHGFDVAYVTHATDPPTFLVFFEPLTLFRPRSAYLMWQVLNAAALAASVFLLLSSDPFLDRRTRTLLSALALLYYPVTEHIQYGQSKTLLLLLLVLLMRCLEKGREAAAGALLATAGLFRIYPLLLVAYLATYKRWRAIFYAVIALTVGLLVTIYFAGLRNTLAFSSGLRLLRTEQVVDEKINISIYAFCSRLFSRLVAGEITSEGNLLRLALVTACDLSFLLCTVKATLPTGRFCDPEWSGLSLWVTLSLLLPPTSWPYNMVMLLIPFAQIAKAATRAEPSHRTILLSLVSYALITVSFVLVYVFRNWTAAPFRAEVLTFFEECRFFAMLLAWFAVYYFARDVRRQGTSCRDT